MSGTQARTSDARLSDYLGQLASVIGRVSREGPLRDYCTGLLLPSARKSVEPIAAMTAPDRVSAQHQSLLHFVNQGTWSDDEVLAKVRELVLPAMARREAIIAWVIDDTGFPKHGRHSVGVSHQYCGQSGKQDNCQVAVSLSLANHHTSLPVAYRLYLPKGWAEDAARRTKAGVPDAIEFKTKNEIAREQIEWACEAGLPRGVALMDVSYGKDASLRRRMTELEVQYAAAIRGDARVLAKDGEETSASELGRALSKRAWKRITWRQGTAEPLSSRFARVRVRPCGDSCDEDAGEEWLLIEWPKGEEAPTKFWLSTLPHDIAFGAQVDITMMRWRIERDYHDLKQEVGLGHFEGRGWVGFHHHATLCIAAYGFLISEREAFSPSQALGAMHVAAPLLPEGFRPRGAPAQT
jgi:SRSO17 transposase